MVLRVSVPLLFASTLLAAGCHSMEADLEPAAMVEVSVQPHASMLAMQSLSVTAGILPEVSEIWEGELRARNLADQSVDSHYWSAGFDPVVNTFESFKTISLAPGAYELTLLLERGSQQYVGTAIASIADGTNQVELALHPVIGDHVVDVSITERMADFRFDYDADELSALSAPNLGVIIDGGPAQLFAIGRATGDSLVYLNLTDGPHHLRLDLYDGSLHLAKSRPEQEDIIVAAGASHRMDLIPLRGEATVELAIDGGPASFNIRVPEEVAAEAGGLGSLNAIFAFSGERSVVFETALVLQPTGDGLLAAAVTIPAAHYGVATLSLSFHDASIGSAPGELLGSCTAAITLGAEATVACEVQLRRRALIAGSLLASLGVNVFTEAGAPVAGSVISIEGVLAGITGTGNFGTAGYFQTHVLRGTYVVRAEHLASQKFGERQVTLAPLEIGNFDIFLSSDLEARCGDGHVNPAVGEECDSGGESSTCDSDCTLPLCGDGHANPAAGEACDDGNQASGDGCSSTCTSEDVFAFRSAGTLEFVAPATCTRLAVKMWGGGGGGGHSPAGGGGGFTTGVVSVSPSESLTIVVGEGGEGRIATGSGDGGGGTALLRTGTPLLVAGGGGGGGSGNTPAGGAGGGASGQTGASFSGGGLANGGSGGTQTAPGAGGSGSRRTGFAGSGRDGGHGANACGGSGIGGGGTGYGTGGLGYRYCGDGGSGGGGGGWFGGGGGGGNTGGGGGGGGSGYVASSPEVTDGSTLAGSGEQPGNAADSDRQDAGAGGPTSARGHDGAVIIRCQNT